MTSLAVACCVAGDFVSRCFVSSLFFVSARINSIHLHKRKMASVVSGASKGIGLAFTRYLVSTAPRTVFAVSRSVTNELQTLIDETKKSTLGARLIHVPCDLNDDDSIFSAVQTIQQNLNNNQGVELLLNVAGILGDNSVQQPGPERSITVIQREWLRKSFEVSLCY